MSPRWFLLLTAVCLAGCSRVPADRQAASPESPLARAPQVGQPAPEIDGVDLDGQRFRLSDYRGKVVMLDFWKTY